MKKTKKGFTLIELLVVIGIIGLLASLAIVSLNSARAKSRDAVRLSNMQRIVTSLEQFYDAKGHYPSFNVGGTGALTDTAKGLGYSQKQAPDGFYTGLYIGGFKVASTVGQVTTESATCYDNGLIDNDCNLELTSPMPKEPLVNGVSAGTWCSANGAVGGLNASPCEYTYIATGDAAGNRGFQNFRIFYALESSAPKQFGDGLLCVGNKKGTNCSKTAYAEL